jgi:hypothetical protein
MTYNTYAYAPWEGYRCVFNGTKGRLEVTDVEGQYSAGGEEVTSTGPTDLEKNHIQGGVENAKVVVFPLFKEPYVADVKPGHGGHGVHITRSVRGNEIPFSFALIPHSG